MKNINWLFQKKYNKWGILIIFLLLIIFFIGKAIIESGHIIFYTVCLILGIIAYYSVGKLETFTRSRPASLGREYLKKYPIIVQYAPPKGINPAEAGLLYNCSVESTDLTSLIYQWKFEKLIDIKTFQGDNSKKEYVKLIKLKDMPFDRPLFESEIFDSIFRMGNVKIIEGAFQLRYALMLEDLEYHGIRKGWFVLKEGERKNNKKVSMTGDGISFELFFFSIYLFITALSLILESFGLSSNVPDNYSISFSGFIRFIIIVFGVWVLSVLLFGKMDRSSDLKFTEKGAEMASKVIGYSKFIKSCDENKIKLLLKEDPLFIDRTLPYATAFGMETEFLKKISPLKKDWNARYVRGQKVPSWIKIFRIFVKDDNSLL